MHTLKLVANIDRHFWNNLYNSVKGKNEDNLTISLRVSEIYVIAYVYVHINKGEIHISAHENIRNSQQNMYIWTNYL